MGPSRLPAEYVLPIRWDDDRELADLTDYLHRLSEWLEVTVVDGSSTLVYERHHAAWSAWVRHLPPRPWPGRNGKVAGVVTGVRSARHDAVIIADDDVRWDRRQLEQVLRLLDRADLVRPQNVFDPLPWHARWDTGRMLVNRALGGDYPGTYALRKRTFLDMGGYSGDVLFENLELARTVRAAGGVELVSRDVFVRRRPPSLTQFVRQRVRQAYDDLAQPARLVVEASLLPLTIAVVTRSRAAASDPSHARATMALALLSSMVLAEFGRRSSGGRHAFRPTAALWTPCWLAERAVCVWIALAWRVTGGVPYRGQRVVVAAHSSRRLRRVARGKAPLRPTGRL